MIDFKCAIFDLDGTLIDSTRVWEQVDRDFLGKRGIPVTPDFEREIKLHNFETGSVYVVEKYGLKQTPQEVAKEWFDMAEDAYTNHIQLKTGVKEYLEGLKEKGVKLSIATSSDISLFGPCLKRNGIYHLFDAFTQVSQVGRRKTFPDVYLYAAGRCNTAVKDCVVFEDILSAVKASKEAGFYTVGVADEVSVNDWEDIKNTADVFIKDYTELL